MRAPILMTVLMAAAAHSQTWSPIAAPTSVTRTGLPDFGTGWSRLARHPGGYLVVWEDGRKSATNLRVRGGRVATDGTLLDPGGFALADDVDPFQWDPSVACSSSDVCLVAWRAGQDDARARLVNRFNLQMSEVLQLTDTTSQLGQVPPLVLSDGINFLVAWDCQAFVCARSIDWLASASPIFRFQAPSGVGGPDGIEGTFAFGHYGLAWTQNVQGNAERQAIATTLMPASTTASPPRVLGPSANEAVHVAAGSSEFLVSWLSPVTALRMRRMQSNGTLAGNTTASVISSVPTYAFTGSVFVGFAFSDRMLLSWTLDPTTLATLSPPSQVLMTPRAQPDLLRGSWAQTGGRLLWHHQRREFGGEHTLLQSLDISISPSGVVTVPAGATNPAGIAADTQTDPGAVWTGTAFFAGYNSSAADESRFLGISVSSAGVPGTAPIDLGAAMLPQLPLTMAIVDGELNALWPTATGVQRRRLSLAGTPLAAAELVGTTPPPTTAPIVTSINGITWVMWGGIDGQLYGVPLTRSGPAGPATDLGSLGGSSVIQAQGQTLAWLSGEEVRVARLSGDGRKMPGPPLFSTQGREQGKISLASSGNELLLTWTVSGGSRVDAVRLTPTSAPIGAPFTVARGSVNAAYGSSSWPSALWDGRSFVVGWHEYQSPANGIDVFMRRVSSDGALGPLEVVAAGPHNQTQVHLASDGAGRVLFSFLEFSPADDALRVRFRVLEQGVTGGSCSVNSDCVSQRCDDSRCVALMMPDGGASDGGEISSDAGVTVAGAVDGGTGALPPVARLAVGCGCHSMGNVMLLALPVFLRRKRSPR